MCVCVCVSVAIQKSSSYLILNYCAFFRLRDRVLTNRDIGLRILIIYATEKISTCYNVQGGRISISVWFTDSKTERHLSYRNISLLYRYINILFTLNTSNRLTTLQYFLEYDKEILEILQRYNRGSLFWNPLGLTLICFCTCNVIVGFGKDYLILRLFLDKMATCG